jgi:hypothetical protein
MVLNVTIQSLAEKIDNGSATLNQNILKQADTTIAP